MKITGSTIIVTGASGGIGRDIAIDLAGRGATVHALARREDELEELATAHVGIRAHPCDLTVDDERDRVFAEIGAVDALINNAGVARVGAFLDMKGGEIAEEIALNLTAMIATCASVLPGMLDRGTGHIVNMGSILGFAPGPPLTVYSATKAAVHAFTEGLRRELVGSQVRVTLIAPGPVKGTGALEQGGDEAATATLQKAFDTFGTTTEDVAKAVRTALERDARPSTRTITVPRIAGLSRVAGVPGADWAMDRGFDLLRRAGLKLS